MNNLRVSHHPIVSILPYDRRRNGSGLLVAGGPQLRIGIKPGPQIGNRMTVQITPTSTQHTGMTVSAEGSVAAWHVTFQIHRDESLHVAISIPLSGPPTHQEAQQKALKILQGFLSDACEAAKNYQISN